MRIIKSIKHKILKNSFKPITKSERYSIIIAIKLMNDPETELLLHPFKDRYYIHSKSAEMFMIINKYPQTVTIINHKYSYDIPMTDRSLGIILNKFLCVTENRRDILERDFLKNTEDSLGKICHSLI